MGLFDKLIKKIRKFQEEDEAQKPSEIDKRYTVVGGLPVPLPLPKSQQLQPPRAPALKEAIDFVQRTKAYPIVQTKIRNT